MREALDVVLLENHESLRQRRFCLGTPQGAIYPLGYVKYPGGYMYDRGRVLWTRPKALVGAYTPQAGRPAAGGVVIHPTPPAPTAHTPRKGPQ